MTRYKNVNGVRSPLTAEEEIFRDAQIARGIARQKAKPIIKKYQQDRAKEYPAIGDQLDMLWHSINEDAALKSKYFKFHQAILAVKSKYPK